MPNSVWALLAVTKPCAPAPELGCKNLWWVPQFRCADFSVTPHASNKPGTAIMNYSKQQKVLLSRENAAQTAVLSWLFLEAGGWGGGVLRQGSAGRPGGRVGGVSA